MEISVKVSKLITQIPSLHKEVTIRTQSKIIVEFYVLLSVHPVMILVNKQLDAQFFHVCLFLFSTVSGSHVPIIRRIIVSMRQSGMQVNLYTRRSSTQSDINQV